MLWLRAGRWERGQGLGRGHAEAKTTRACHPVQRRRGGCAFARSVTRCELPACWWMIEARAHCRGKKGALRACWALPSRFPLTPKRLPSLLVLPAQACTGSQAGKDKNRMTSRQMSCCFLDLDSRFSAQFFSRKQFKKSREKISRKFELKFDSSLFDAVNPVNSTVSSTLDARCETRRPSHQGGRCPLKCRQSSPVA